MKFNASASSVRNSVSELREANEADEANEENIESPCVAVCTLDAAGQLCLGCYRTLDEIAAWSELNAAQRRAVLAGAEQRMQACFDD